MKLILKIVWKLEITFLFSKTFLFFLKQDIKYIKYRKYFFLFGKRFFFWQKISKNSITWAFPLSRQILKNIDMPQQKPRHLLTAEANFER